MGDVLLKIGKTEVHDCPPHVLARMLLGKPRSVVSLVLHRILYCPALQHPLGQSWTRPITGYIKGAVHNKKGASRGRLMAMYPSHSLPEPLEDELEDEDSFSDAAMSQKLWPMGLSAEEVKQIRGAEEEEAVAPTGRYVFAYKVKLARRHPSNDFLDGQSLQKVLIAELQACKRLGMIEGPVVQSKVKEYYKGGWCLVYSGRHNERFNVVEALLDHLAFDEKSARKRTYIPTYLLSNKVSLAFLDDMNGSAREYSRYNKGMKVRRIRTNDSSFMEVVLENSEHFYKIRSCQTLIGAIKEEMNSWYEVIRAGIELCFDENRPSFMQARFEAMERARNTKRLSIF